MAKHNVAELLVDVLAEAGVGRLYGVSGDSLDGITDATLSISSGRQVPPR